MCGRYRLSKRKQLVEEYFECVPWDEEWSPRYNIAPSQPIPVIRQNPKEPARELTLMKWGLIPHWAKDPSIAMITINAKSETAAMKPAFRDPLKLGRCLIPADGFYEWRRRGETKRPFCFEINRGDLFAFAGLWDGWKDPNGRWVKSCSILTTIPNAVTHSCAARRRRKSTGRQPPTTSGLNRQIRSHSAYQDYLVRQHRCRKQKKHCLPSLHGE